ncbi:MAG: tRNA pseudouridine(55) synthase TruB [Candidatus Nanopelagicaceae bacterium]|nr:tRNA pseudouridine(55) synthase TruB [Candidatus Nanopelagicaceae bacterium]
MRSGFLVIDKDQDFTSHDVVALARKSLKEKRIGHAGTLDPMATGVLVLGVGHATRLLSFITDGSKTYLATIRLGSATNTDDAQGEVISIARPAQISAITDLLITEELAKRTGDISQRPSSVSAIKVDGVRSYKRVRDGEAVELEARPVHIFSQKIIKISRVDDFIDVEIEVTCSAGTYIRAIARDLGNTFDVGGHLIALRRTHVGTFTIENSITSTELKNGKEPKVMQLVDAVRSLFKVREINDDEEISIFHGRAINKNSEKVNSDLQAAINSVGEVIAILEPRDGRLHPSIVFPKAESK